MSSLDKPNIVMVVMDTARAQNFSCYGYERKTSPFLDNLAEENVIYKNAYTQANWTLPSHASMFSGQYFSNHNVVEKNSFESLDLVMDELDDSYSRMSVTNVPFLSESFDFDLFFDDFYYNSEKDFWRDVDAPESVFEKESTLETIWEASKYFLKEKRFGKLFEGFKRFSKKWLMLRDSGASKTNKKAIEMIKQSENENFFLFLNYFEPHAPYRPPFPYSHKFLDNKFRWKSLIDSVDENLRKYLGTDLEPSEKVIELKKAVYDAEIRYLDSKLEELYSTIKEEHPNTVFIFTADHGQYFYEKGRVNHVLGLNDEVTHVPLIEVFPDGRSDTVESCVELRNLRQHIFDLSSGNLQKIESREHAVSEDPGMDGSDFSTVERLSGRNLDDDVKKKFSRYRASITDGERRLVRYEDGESSVFKNGESGEVSVSDLSKKLESIIGESATLSKKDDMEVEEEDVKDRLEDLGYL